MQSQLPRHLVGGFVEAGKHPARGNRLKLGEDVPIVSLFLLKGAVGQHAADFARVADGQRCWACGKITGYRKTHEILCPGFYFDRKLYIARPQAGCANIE